MDKPKPLAAFRKRLGINSPGIALGVVAIVIALTGAAFAAGGLTASQTKQVKKIAQTEAKKFVKPGPPGTPGSAGAVGPAGSQGAKGDTGAPGKDGISTEVTPFTGAKGPCTEGGVEVKSAKPITFVCNGEEGEKGEDGEKGDKGDTGDPWTAGGTLPPGATETGSWAYNGTSEDTAGIQVPISFSIPMPFSLGEGHVHYVAQEKSECEAESEPEKAECLANLEAACPSTTPILPEAAPGELCVYESRNENAISSGVYRYNAEPGFKGAGRAGALLSFEPTGGVAFGADSFAVTGCTKTVQAPPNPAIECPA